MKEVSPKEKEIINEWKKRRTQYEEAKQALKNVLDKYGIASTEFNAARVEFEMLKEEFDNFAQEHHDVLSGYL